MFIMDEILDVIVDRTLQRPIKIPRASHERLSVENLWSTIWGKVISKIRNEIFYNGGIEAETKLQRRFCNRFRVPFSIFETMVIECKADRRGVQVTWLSSAHSSVAEILDCGKTNVKE